ncbi:hypothetical protein HSTV2_76 [Halorubrum sodomense tailed virus 2]|uniref:Uncharacterized protein n=1 Tax=Halorubrum sodomense tailed virus 2 TaxID=1262527 RepID=L7TIX6_9CAUD|nr:hypothetical protein HSTV2_76 [Halorubrum sodomense tailed virus 2]AGC34343.1 hypothetical protein HSTV2_76 [Halorubrum sodomense tailed virus 2]
MTPSVPVRVPGHRLQGDDQHPERGLHHVSEDEAVQIIRGMVAELDEAHREEVRTLTEDASD